MTHVTGHFTAHNNTAHNDTAHNNEVTVLTRVNCHLCDEALPVVHATLARANSEGGATWTLTTVDIDSDPELLARYDWEVPVVLINGRQHSFHRVDPHRLLTALRKAAR